MSKRLVLSICLIFLAQFLIAVFLITYIEVFHIQLHLDEKVRLITTNLDYKDGSWDNSKYNSNPALIGSYPLYVLTTDGFVLDRRSPITGFLDSSDFANLLEYETPKNYTSVTGNVRRILSIPLKDEKDTPIAVIAVAYSDPKDPILLEIDETLTETAKSIQSKIRIVNATIDVGTIDEAEVPYSISFLIVDRYNTIFAKSTNVNAVKRIPTFIDPSHVKNQLSSQGLQLIRESGSGEFFLVLVRPLVINKEAQGVVAVGESLQATFLLLWNFGRWYGVTTVGVGLLSFFLLRKQMLRNQPVENLQTPRSIWFDEKQSVLHIDQSAIDVSYASNQYCMLKALFSNQKKRWETDELLEKFGEEVNEKNARKVYDTMANINKKLSGFLRGKLIIHQNKTYYLSPDVPIAKAQK